MSDINPYHRNVQAILNGGRVRRYHTRPLVGEQTNAAHSWGVAALVLALCPTATRALLVAALFHDVAEYETGDIPATTKWASPSLKSALDELEEGVEERLGISAAGLSETERRVLKLADMLELVIFCRHQQLLGNRYAEEIENNGLKWLASKDAEWRASNNVLDLAFSVIANILSKRTA